jgi:SAM-dependent methyltransferase
MTPPDAEDRRPQGHDADEARAVRERYARRAPQDPRYSLLNPAALAAWQERQRAVARLLRRLGHADPSSLDVLEVGCGTGSQLLDLILLGFSPSRLAGIELLPERLAVARERLPGAVTLWQGDATAIDVPPARYDIVLQATVFSSLLDDAYQQRLADAMWRTVRPGGGVVWYDFTVDNPRNRDVRGVPLARVRALFPEGRVRAQRITVAPPLARAVVRLHPGLYGVLNLVPMLRTHRLCWIGKDA